MYTDVYLFFLNSSRFKNIRLNMLAVIDVSAILCIFLLLEIYDLFKGKAILKDYSITSSPTLLYYEYFVLL